MAFEDDIDMSFDAIDTASVEFDTPVPAGTYKMVVNSGVIKKSQKDATSSYLALEFEIVEGEQAGRKLFHNFNLWNANPVAKKIALQEIKKLCFSIWGEDKRLTSPQMFFDQYCTVTVKTTKDHNGDIRGEIGTFLFDRKAANERAQAQPNLVKPQQAPQRQPQPIEDDPPF